MVKLQPPSFSVLSILQYGVINLLYRQQNQCQRHWLQSKMEPTTLAPLPPAPKCKKCSTMRPPLKKCMKLIETEESVDRLLRLCDDRLSKEIVLMRSFLNVLCLNDLWGKTKYGQSDT